ncbi:RES family NAD+ phosphorylase [Mucilaginibacter robiniae]|uniref:RES family NAD+ phosphorylase n=1 Tax=Mucilaginibacter robiniae TaxID=2728022 RepID=A0A7L5E2C2_9SPHI|nr:RES family NAD+ phosphorylase [Mucilaginibacter robiniae]QJD97520.1 RES family NAD+ phosphorylase [Mucilaginibacter robiniae]
MVLYRIAKCNYINDLSGTGARLYGGRWNSVGNAMLYLASSRSLALLEVLVHLPPMLVPANYCILSVDVPDDIHELDVTLLPPNWQQYPEPAFLRTLGDQFIKQREHLLLKVPSAIVKQEYNYLLNPAHNQATEVKVLHQDMFSFDERLI